MADVQLEHGYLRIANALDEAIIVADFSGTQHKQVRCIIRLTYGWRQRNVQIAMADLAAKCGVSNTGGFRRELEKLIAEGVIIEVARGHGRTPATYALNKDFEEWGTYSVPRKALERHFGVKPPSLYRVPPQGQATGGDNLPPEGQSTEPPTAPSGADNGTEPDSEPESCLPPQGNLSAPVETDDCPHRGRHEPSNPHNDAELQPPKDSERHERQLLLQERARSFATKLVGAANNANAERFGEWTRTKPYIWSTATQMCFELLQAGVDESVACTAVAESIRHTKKPKPANSITYFANVIDDAWAAHQQRQLDAENPAPARPAKRDTGPSRLNVSVDARQVSIHDQTSELRRLQSEYEIERLRVADAWLQDPANRAQALAIKAAADDEFREMLDTKWGQKAHAQRCAVKAADAAGFPDFEVWRAQRVDRPHGGSL